MSLAVRALLASGAVVVSATSGFAQTQTTTTSDATGTTTTTATGGAAGVSGLQGASSAPDGGEALQLQSTIGSVTSADAANANVQRSNPLAGYYANPLYQGRAGSTIGTSPGGFGTALYSTTGASTGVGGNARAASGTASTAGRTTGTGLTGTTGFGTTSTTTTGRTTTGTGTTAFGTGTTAAGRTGATGLGTTTGFGTTGFGTTATGRTGTTGFGTTTGTGRTGVGQNTGEVIAPVRALITTSTARLPAPVIAAPQMQADLRGVLDRSSMLTNARGIELAMDGRTVVLRGSVKDEEEARTAEGMIRLTPGVAAVRNELRY